MNTQTIRNRAFAGLPTAVSEGRFTGLTIETQYGPCVDVFGGNGKLTRLAPIPFKVRSKRAYRRVNGPVRVIRPIVA